MSQGKPLTSPLGSGLPAAAATFDTAESMDVSPPMASESTPYMMLSPTQAMRTRGGATSFCGSPEPLSGTTAVGSRACFIGRRRHHTPSNAFAVSAGPPVPCACADEYIATTAPPATATTAPTPRTVTPHALPPLCARWAPPHAPCIRRLVCMDTDAPRVAAVMRGAARMAAMVDENVNKMWCKRVCKHLF